MLAFIKMAEGEQSVTRLRIIALAIALGQYVAQPAHADNLLDIYHKALANDARYAAALGAHQAGIEKLPQGRASLLPTLTVTGEKTRFDSEIEYTGTTSFEGGDRRYEERRGTATLTQPLYRKQNFATYQQSKAQYQAAEAQLVLAKQDLILRAAQTYFDLLSAQQVLAAASAHAAATKAAFEQARAKLRVGAASRLEFSEAKARADIAHSQEIAAGNEVINKRQALRRVTHETPTTLDELAPNYPLVPPSPNAADEWVRLAERDNAQLVALRHNLRAAEQEVVRARGGHHPNIDLVAQYTATNSTGSVYTSAESDTHIKSAGVRLELPLYQGGLIGSKVREAVGNLEKARGELEDAQRDMTSQVIQLFNTTASGVEQVRSLDQALLSSQEAAKASRVGLDVGTRNFVEVLDADKLVYEVARELTKAWQEYVMSSLRLKAFAGQLSENDLFVLNSYLVPPSGR